MSSQRNQGDITYNPWDMDDDNDAQFVVTAKAQEMGSASWNTVISEDAVGGTVLTSILAGAVFTQRVPTLAQDFIITSYYREIDFLQKRITELENTVGRLQTEQTQVVFIEEVPIAVAKEKVESYFIEHGEADLEDLITNLKIPLRKLVAIIDELKEEGKLSPKED